ncbi:unnamed protein product [Pleuronectes platessa]|uniref:Uncharacterized protein n=1 Tax=Pleuronectes platessa TaxID=8262 RepID=A0A9N7VXK8_PLEPL|nr:unnamed protein product [Pleuronectes platessa]
MEKLFASSGSFPPPPPPVWSEDEPPVGGVESKGLSQGLLTPGEVQSLGPDSQAFSLFPARLIKLIMLAPLEGPASLNLRLSELRGSDSQCGGGTHPHSQSNLFLFVNGL